MANIANIPSSFRDPSGFVYLREGVIFRQVNPAYKEDYDYLINSGLYNALVSANLLIPHEEVDLEYAAEAKAYKIIKPVGLSFISYPYEWCFSQLKDAALATLKIQKIALEFGMSLKDCSAYNIQYRKCKPLFIDTFSFERYVEGKPWIAYRQFCQHFLAPLVLMSYVDVRLHQFLRVYIDGIPLDLSSLLLPWRTYLRFSIFSHIHLQAVSQKYFSDKTINAKNRKMSRFGLPAIVDSLQSLIQSLKWKPRDVLLANYYENTCYSPRAFNHKKQVVSEYLNRINPHTLWDIGANTGLFSRIASSKGVETVSFDADPAAVEKNYSQCLKEGETNILPLLIDFINPSPNIGWENQERMDIFKRGPVDAALALALIHHLAISYNLPLSKIAEFFKKICKSLIIEFVPKDDFQVKRLLSSRQDIFPDYTQRDFEDAFSKYFRIEDSLKIQDSERIIYLMEKNK